MTSSWKRISRHVMWWDGNGFNASLVRGAPGLFILIITDNDSNQIFKYIKKPLRTAFKIANHMIRKAIRKQKENDKAKFLEHVEVLAKKIERSTNNEQDLADVR